MLKTLIIMILGLIFNIFIYLKYWRLTFMELNLIDEHVSEFCNTFI